MNKVTSSRHPLSEWIYDVLQNVVIHTNSHISTTNEPEQPEPDHKKSQKLIDGAYFNEKIINTYPWVILGIVLVISSIHWSGELLRWRNRVLQKRNERYSYDILDDEPLASKPVREDVILIDYGSASSSGSSTSGSNTPSIQSNTEDEHIPLLEGGRFSKSSSNRITIKSQIKAFLIYQPRPLPYFNKVLPSNSSSLFILSFLALNIFYTFYNITFTAFEASVLGDRAGLVFGVNLPLLYLLGAKNQPLKLLTGVSYESLNILHRRLGEILMVAALIHAGGMFIMWYTFLQPFRGWTLWAYLSHPCIYFGLLALFTYKLLYVTSLASFRQRWYEVFLGLHVVLQASALIILYFHHRGTRTYVGWAIVVFLVDRLVYRLCAKSTMAEVSFTSLFHLSRELMPSSFLYYSIRYSNTPPGQHPRLPRQPNPPPNLPAPQSPHHNPLPIPRALHHPRLARNRPRLPNRPLPRPYPRSPSSPLHHRIPSSSPLFQHIHPQPPNPRALRLLPRSPSRRLPQKNLAMSTRWSVWK